MTAHGLSLQERFELYVSPEPNTGCYLWMGFGVWNGYGCFAVESAPVKAHRLAYEFHYGPIPRVAKGRQARNMSMGKVKLSPEQVQAIRQEKGTHRVIGLRYGIGRSQVRRIQLGEAWAHLK